MASINQPNNTLYVSNIDWKIKKPLLRRALYTLFTRHGKILEVIALRKDGLRGQAFVIFEDITAATDALQAQNGTAFFGKDLKVAYSAQKSDRIAKRDGTYVQKAKREKKKAKVPPTDTTPMDTTTTTSTDATDPPSHILLAQDLPVDVTQDMLQMLFQTYAGFKEVRIPRPGLAFMEFEESTHATLAKERLQGFQLTKNNSLNLVYGKS